ncbi:MAG TPA: hypothetical protein VFL14_08990 [Xanthomonadales bacterium]|nr:hypothetical protein [Xanthomonadales bacterium]
MARRPGSGAAGGASGGSSERIGIARNVLWSGGLLFVLLLATLLVRVGMHWLPFAWDPTSPWPAGGVAEPARVVRSELAILEDDAARASGRHRLQLFVLVATARGERWLAGPARDPDDLVAGPGQLWTMVGEAAALVGPLEPVLRVPSALARALDTREPPDAADAAAYERWRIATAVAGADEWPALRAFAAQAPLALRVAGDEVAVDAQWQAEAARRASTGTRLAGIALVAIATFVVFVATRTLLPVASRRGRTIAALVVAASFPWWSTQWPALAGWLAPTGAGGSLGIGVRAIVEAPWLSRGATMPLHAADARTRAAVDALESLPLARLRGYTASTRWLATVPIEPRTFAGPSWERFAAAEAALHEAAIAAVPAADDATLAALDAELAQRRDAADPTRPIARLRAAVVAERARRGGGA